MFCIFLQSAGLSVNVFRYDALHLSSICGSVSQRIRYDALHLPSICGSVGQRIRYAALYLSVNVFRYDLPSAGLSVNVFRYDVRISVYDALIVSFTCGSVGLHCICLLFVSLSAKLLNNVKTKPF